MSKAEKLTVELERDTYAPGETVTGHVVVHEHLDCKRLQVLLRLREHTASYQGTGGEVASGTLHEGELDAPLTIPFSLPLPDAALPNVSAPHSRLQWEVHVERKALTTHLTARPIVVAICPT